MMLRSFDVLLCKQTDATWASDALSLPKARLTSVKDIGGAGLPFLLNPDVTVGVQTNDIRIIGRIELSEELVELSTLEKTKVDLERDKLSIEERAGRRTLWVSIATAVVSAAATIVVALITHLDSNSTASPKAYQDLVECRESLNRLHNLAVLEQQTLQKLQAAVSLSIDSCSERLNTAILASKP